MKDGERSIGQHLQELRRRLTLAALATVATTVLSFVFYKEIIELLLRPADNLAPPRTAGAVWYSWKSPRCWR